MILIFVCSYQAFSWLPPSVHQENTSYDKL